MRFAKLHGAGNDYLVVDGWRGGLPADLAALARRMADRRFGAGSDGLIVLEPDSRADFRMRMFNADGTEAEMCGNGLRCAFKYARDRGLVAGDRAVAQTGAGPLAVLFVRRAGRADTIRIDMGRPRLTTAHLAAAARAREPLSVTLAAAGRRFEVACVSTGNPHAVVFLDEDPAAFPVERFGPALAGHAWFPGGTNVHFARCVDRHLVVQRTWERGSGETLACGTGACATVAAGCLTGRLASPVTVRARGGELRVEWPSPERAMTLEGPAEEVFTGEWPGA